MRISTIASRDVGEKVRLDAKFHLSKQNPFLQQLRAANLPSKRVDETVPRASVWTGNIFTRVYAEHAEHGRPLLVPYDVFRYIPWSDKILSETQVSQFEKLKVKRGTLLIVCSGRNLGPVTIADLYCERFVMSHDMVRIEGDYSDEFFYLAAFLSTPYGQATIRTDMNGSVIDHTDANQVAAIRYPLIEESSRTKVAALFREAFETRERARLQLEQTRIQHASHFGISDLGHRYGAIPARRRFSVNRRSLVDRIDAEANSPAYDELRERIRACGGRPLFEIADVRKPASRYKTNYVEDAAYGIPMLNGRQIAQYRPIAARLMSLAGFKKPEQFQLQAGTTVLTADGRAEENLADCAFITEERAGWGASGHVHRVVPKEGINAGLIYLGCSSPPVQAQLKSLATGSVVDALSEDDLAATAIPYEESDEAFQIGDAAAEAWRMFSIAVQLEDQAMGSKRCFQPTALQGMRSPTLFAG